MDVACRAMRRGEDEAIVEPAVGSVHDSETQRRHSAWSSCTSHTRSPDGTSAISDLPGTSMPLNSLSSLSTVRAGRGKRWGRVPRSSTAIAPVEAQTEVNTGKRARALTAQEEMTLTLRLQRYYKLKDRFDIMKEHIGREPTMDEFAEQLGTTDVDRISALMVSGPDVKAAFVKHNMGLVVSICQKYHTEDVSMSVSPVIDSAYSSKCALCLSI